MVLRNVLCCSYRERILRVLSRIFCGLLFAVTLLFAGVAPSFAALPSSQSECEKQGYQWDPNNKVCCLYFYTNGKDQTICVTEENWKSLFGELRCTPANTGYIGTDGKPHCCPEGTSPDPETHLCCRSPLVFNIEKGICEEEKPTTNCNPGEFYSGKGCETCQPGYYCPGDDTAHSCQGRTQYTDTTGATTYSTVSSGYYTTGCTSNNTCTGQSQCTAGHFCKNGVSYDCSNGSYSTSNGATSCSVCASGTTNSNTGNSSSTCTACSNNANVAIWNTTSWNNNGTVNNLCSISTCDNNYTLQNNVCVQSNTNCYKFAIDNTTNGGNNNNGATTEFWMYRNTSNLSDSQNCKIYPTSADCVSNTNVIGVNDSIVLPNPPSHAHYYGQYSTTGHNASYPTNEGWFDSNGVNNIAVASSYGRCANSSYTNAYFYALVNTYGFQASSTPSITLRTLYACDYGYHLDNGSCVANTITLDWDEDGGLTIANGTCTYGGNLVLPSAPTRAGYTFTNWWLADATYHDAGETITGGCNSTYTGVYEGTSQYIHALWTPIDYTITYDFTNGGAFGSNTTHPDTYNITSSDFTISRPTYTGHNFSGWTVSTAPTAWGNGSSSTGALDFTVATGTYGNITLTATWDTSTITCSSGEYLPAGATSCSACLAGYRCPSQSATYSYNANNAQGLTACSNSTQYQNETGQTYCKNVSTGYYKQSNSAQHVCPTGYQSGPGAANESGCQASCAAGQRVATVYGVCDSPASGTHDGWFTSAHNVYYGSLSPVTYCMLGYVNNDTGAAKHNSIATCRSSVAAGYYIPDNKIHGVTAIRVVAPSNQAVDILELEAYTNPAGDIIDNSLLRNGTSSIAATGNVASGMERYATNKNWTDKRYTRIVAGGVGVWEFSVPVILGSLRLALLPAEPISGGVRIDVRVNGDWYSVFNLPMLQDAAISIGNHGELIVLSSMPVVCDGGTYSTGAAVALGDTPGCSTLGSEYYSNGGGTSATPAGTNNGCLSGYTCGRCPSGYRDSSTTGKTAITQCKANITLNKNGGTGTVNGTTGTTSATKECSYNTACDFGTANLVPTSGGYIFAGGWGTSDSCESATTSFTNPTGTYYACVNSCSYTNSSAATPSSNICAGTCDTGYSTSGGSNTGGSASCSGTSCSCSGRDYTVTLDKNGGSGGTTTVTATFGEAMPTITLPSSPHGYENFSGYFGGSNNTMYYDSTGASAHNWDIAQNSTLTASWSGDGISCSPGYYLAANATTCNTPCPSGYYCPGNQAYAVSSSAQGLVACPARQSNDLGNSTVSVGSDANASEVTNCFIHWLPDGCAASVAPKNYGGGVNITTIYYSEKVKVYAQNDGTGGQDAYPTADQYIYPAKLYSLPGYKVKPDGSYNGVSNAVTIPEIGQSGYKGLYGIVGKSCEACTGNSYGPGGGQVKWHNPNTVTTYGECKSCASGLTASSLTNTVYHDDAGDCGRVLHVGNYEVRLKSIPSGFTVPSPSVRFDYNNDGTADFYARMVQGASFMRNASDHSLSNKKFKIQYNNTPYHVCDDGTCN